ncbi:MAG: hypothetical protein ACRC33_25495 [Gemmataceae bacterium]
MVLEQGQMDGILQELLTPTLQGTLRWSLDGDCLSVALPSRLLVALTRNADGNMTASVQRVPDELLGTLDGPAARDSVLSVLYQAALDSAKRDVYAEIIQAIKVKTTLDARPAAPDAGARVLTAMKGPRI